ncbi:MAG: CARDB domain-containing protein [Candidatus Ratteibacteria bacterium]|nr:CARDB domain-containing protein [Candidatus Ratteibacteria bacterium]
MKLKIAFVIFTLFLSSFPSLLAQSKTVRKSTPIKSSPVKTKSIIPKSTMKATAKIAELPPQPKSNRLALPDITIKEFRFSGTSGPWVSGRTYQVRVVLENIGQYETGAFLLKLNVRIQTPASQTLTVGTKRIPSIQPRKTGVPGTYTATFNYTLGNYNWAQYTFSAEADSTGHIEEFDEGNNTKFSIDLTVEN